MHTRSLRVRAHRSFKLDENVPPAAVGRLRRIAAFDRLRAAGCNEAAALETIGIGRGTLYRWKAALAAGGKRQLRTRRPSTSFRQGCNSRPEPPDRSSRRTATVGRCGAAPVWLTMAALMAAFLFPQSAQAAGCKPDAQFVAGAYDKLEADANGNTNPNPDHIKRMRRILLAMGESSPGWPQDLTPMTLSEVRAIVASEGWAY